MILLIKAAESKAKGHRACTQGVCNDVCGAYKVCILVLCYIPPNLNDKVELVCAGLYSRAKVKRETFQEAT